MSSRFSRTRSSGEHGWVLVTAVIVMTLMLGLGLALMKVVDTQAQLSGKERIRESAFNLAEGLLTAEAAVLQHNWPSKPACTGNGTGCALPSAAVNTSGQNACTNGNAATYPQCPNPTEIATAFKNVDTGAATWSIQVRDDRVCAGQVNPIYFKGTGAPNCAAGNPGGVDATSLGCTNETGGAQVCNYDTNGGSPNRRVWVRVDATVQGKTRSIVALLQLEKLAIPFPATTVTAGSVNFSNAGNKVIVDTTSPGTIVARCASLGATTLASNPINNNTVFTVNANGNTPANYTANANYVLGSPPNAETVTLLSAVQPGGAGTPITITLKNPAVNPHTAGDRFLLAPGAAGNTCEQWLNNVQVSPAYNYVENPNYPTPALSIGDLTLIEQGGATVWPAGTCPSTNADWSGQVVILQAPAAGCSMSPPGNAPINSASAPGFVIVVDQAGGAGNGPALTIPNNTTYYGVLYMANKQGGTGATKPVMQIGANAQICGGVSIDGAGQIFIGQANNGNSAIFCNGHQTGASIIFDPNAFNAFSAAGAAGLVQNTWRELPAGQ